VAPAATAVHRHTGHSRLWSARAPCGAAQGQTSPREVGAGFVRGTRVMVLSIDDPIPPAAGHIPHDHGIQEAHPGTPDPPSPVTPHQSAAPCSRCPRLCGAWRGRSAEAGSPLLELARWLQRSAIGTSPASRSVTALALGCRCRMAAERAVRAGGQALAPLGGSVRPGLPAPCSRAEEVLGVFELETATASRSVGTGC